MDAPLEAAPALTPAERVCAVAAAAAHDLNNEMTVILSGLSLARASGIAVDHPAYQLLLDVQSAAVRCAWRASELLNFAGRYGATASAKTLDRVIDNRGASVGR